MSRRPPPVPLFGDIGQNGKKTRAKPRSPPEEQQPQQQQQQQQKQNQQEEVEEEQQEEEVQRHVPSSSLKKSVEDAQHEIDVEVDLRISQMRVDTELRVKNMQRRFDVEMARLPDFVRNMTFSEFIQRTNGTGDVAVLVEQISKNMRSDFDSWVSEIHTPRRSARILQNASKTKKETGKKTSSKRKIVSSSQHNDFNPAFVPEFSAGDLQTPGPRRSQRIAKVNAQHNIQKMSSKQPPRQSKKVSTIPEEIPEEPMTPVASIAGNAPMESVTSSRTDGPGSIAVIHSNKLVLDEEFTSRLNRVDAGKRKEILSTMAKLQKMIDSEVDLPED